MFKLLDRIVEHWNKKRAENCWHFLIELGEMFAFVLVLFGLSKLIALFLAKTAFFSSYSNIDLISFTILGVIIAVIGLAQANHEYKEDKRAKAKLVNRQISDYEKKYQKYVDLVENLLHTKGYEEIRLADDWVKQFDRHLTNTAGWKQRQGHDFTYFELATCLMFSLISKIDSLLYVDFAFQCAKEIINCPAVYTCNYLDGGELNLDVQATYGYINDFSILTPEQDAFVVSILTYYLYAIDTCDQILEMANFLKILFIYCEQRQ